MTRSVTQSKNLGQRSGLLVILSEAQRAESKDLALSTEYRGAKRRSISTPKLHHNAGIIQPEFTLYIVKIQVSVNPDSSQLAGSMYVFGEVAPARIHRIDERDLFRAGPAFQLFFARYRRADIGR